MDQGLAALLGAAIGGAAAALAAVVAGRAARHQARSQERLWRNQTRREIYTEYYSALDSALAAADDVRWQAARVCMRTGFGADQGVAQLTQESTPERQEERDEAQRRIAALKPLYVRVAFEGPPPVRNIAKELNQAIKAHVRYCVDVAVSRDGSPPGAEYLPDIRDELRDGKKRLNELAERFLSETTRVLDGEIDS